MWFLIESIFSLIENAKRDGFVETAEHRTQLQAIGFSPERISSVKGSVATINITGVLTQEPDIMAMIFGGGNTTYPEIIGAIAAADTDKDVKDISIFIDTPGGEVAGMFQAMDAIRDARKPTTIIIGNMAASAGYGLASQGDTILASHISSRAGSIGTVATVSVSDNEVSVASDNAPEKRPDVKTQEGIDAVKREVNDMAALLDAYIAEGRSTTVKKVNANFGKGGMVLAEAAISQGMIDGMVSDSKPASSTSASRTTQESQMDIEQFKAEHAAVYAAAKAEGVAQGVKDEKARVCAHLSSGETCGDMTIAVKAINEDVKYGEPTVSAAYDNAARSKSQLQANIEDDKDLSAADGNQAPETTELSDEDKNKESALAQVEASMGVTAGDRDFLYQGGVK